MSHYQIEVGVAHHQFYVWDPSVRARAPDQFTDDDVRRMVKVADNVVVVQPIRNGTVPVDVSLHRSDPGFDEADCDHVVECSVHLPGGKLQVHECTGDAVLDVDVVAGAYVVRVLFHSLAGAATDGSRGDDRYSIQLWPGARRRLSVVLQWQSGGDGQGDSGTSH